MHLGQPCIGTLHANFVLSNQKNTENSVQSIVEILHLNQTWGIEDAHRNGFNGQINIKCIRNSEEILAFRKQLVEDDLPMTKTTEPCFLMKVVSTCHSLVVFSGSPNTPALIGECQKDS
ncbi:hypothetical protein DEO72_LG3g121 [Vigna unguiculata]|uniref:Uncharacterized protein n=1 Tax=Vigna unguiculata TaxID=3917 RepID=A0A4D6LAL2_VIGUN|nr:hypothetical protein DEO72_LG3g121 [Vigna unguiculata]